MQAKGGGFMETNHDPTIDLSLNTASIAMSMDTREYETVLTRATVESQHPFSQFDVFTLSHSISTSITSFKSVVSPSAVSAASFNSSSKRPKRT